MFGPQVVGGNKHSQKRRAERWFTGRSGVDLEAVDMSAHRLQVLLTMLREQAVLVMQSAPSRALWKG